MNKINLDEEISTKGKVDILIIGGCKNIIDVVSLVVLDLKRREKVSRVGICNVTNKNDIKKINSYFETYNDFNTRIEYYSNDYESAISSFKPGDVCILSSNFQISMCVVNQGLHVLSIPPITETLEQHSLLSDAAKSKGVLVCSDMNKRFDPMYSNAKQKIQNSGQMNYFHSFKFVDFDLDIKQTCYMNANNIDYLIKSIGPQDRPIRVTAFSSNDLVTINVIWQNFHTKNKSISTFSSSCKKNIQKLSYIGDNGVVEIDTTDDFLLMKYEPDDDGNFDGQNCYAYVSIYKFIQAVRDIEAGFAVVDSFHDSLATIDSTYFTTAILEASIFSINNTGWPIEIKHPK